MRDRHHPRVCRSCRAPMARQEERCWRCAAAWASGSASPAAPMRDRPSSLHARAGHVLVTRARRQASAARRLGRPEQAAV